MTQGVFIDLKSHSKIIGDSYSSSEPYWFKVDFFAELIG